MITLEIKSKISLIRNNYDYISNGKFYLIKEQLLKETLCYQQMYYLNPHTDNEDVSGEYTLEIYFDFDLFFE
jgi:hypothetical protein